MERTVPPELRRERILSLVREREFVRVADLSAMFGISEVTVRSDLDLLNETGSLQRVHGGAVVRPAAAPRAEPSFEESEVTAAEEKAAIGRRAAELVSNGETIILDVGSTTAAVARALVARETLHDIVVFTSAISVALELEPAIPRFTVVVTGGTLRPLQHSLVEPMANNILERVNVSTVFLGCNGVHPTEGVTNVNLPETAVKRHMLDASQRCVVVAQGSKIGNISVVKIADVDAVDVLVTGSSAPPEVLDELGGLIPAIHVA
ncbi:MAG: DeoR/GlpR transcriptional regulator [Deltaproteobacteria bacterium]|jgi:DeoR family transcriptional regulator of aga operon|nr:DeoR/GlpR transcriptional regulator [Deltaproteobacteria bacterium]